MGAKVDFIFKDLKELPDLSSSDTMRLRVTIKQVNDEKEPRVDIRQYATTERYSGWTPKGVMFTVEQYRELRKAIGGIDAALAELGVAL